METLHRIREFDLVTPDGMVTSLKKLPDNITEAVVFIEDISPDFVGFQIDPEDVYFNIKSTLAQIGIDGYGIEYELDQRHRCAQIKVHIKTYGALAKEMLPYIEVGAIIGKLFAADKRRQVRDPEYLSRMFGRSDRWGSPLLSLGGLQGSKDLILDKVDGRTIAYLTLQNGRIEYAPTIKGFFPTIGKALITDQPMRELLKLHQTWKTSLPRNVTEGEILLVRTLPLHIRTVFARVVPEYLSEGFQHTTADILQPDTSDSGDIYELYGLSKRELTDVPLEFYTLEPYREHVFFSDRDQLQECIEDPGALFRAFATSPQPLENRAAVFIAKGEQLIDLSEEDWVSREPRMQEFPGPLQELRQARMVEHYIEQQPAYPFLKAIDDGYITSQGILLTRFFPSPLMKRMLLSNQVQRMLKGIYFQHPSHTFDDYFSSEDRAVLHDLHTFAIPTFWVDEKTNQILRYVEKPGLDTGLFVPMSQVDTFLHASVFGIYGSNLLEGDFEEELRHLLTGLLELKEGLNHPLLSHKTPLALVTGGGPGVMEVGNRIAKELGILSCANILDFRLAGGAVVNEQQQNTYVEAKMTYRLDKLVERQAEFNLDFPIFLVGGVGTDFEFCLEEVRRKVGATPATPVLLFGNPGYWKDKISSRFKSNVTHGTNKGSEWLSNCLFAVNTGAKGLQVYRDFFEGKLKIGPNGPTYEEGFVNCC